MRYIYAIMIVGIIVGIAVEAYLEKKTRRRNNDR